MTQATIGRRRASAGLAAVMAGLLALSGCNGGGSAGTAGSSLADMEPLKLKLSAPSTAKSSTNQAMQAFADEVAERTNGKITFEVFAEGSLLPSTEAVAGMKAGIADMAQVSTQLFPQDFPIISWMQDLGSLPSAFPLGQMEGTAALMEVARSTKEIEAEFTKNNMHLLLLYTAYAPTDMVCNKKVSTLAEAKGKRIRVSSQTGAAEVEALGAVPVTGMPADEFYESLQRGVVDCNILWPGGYISRSLWEVAPHYTPTRFIGNMASAMVFSKQRWDSLPAEAKTILNEAAGTLAAKLVEFELKLHNQFATEGPTKYNVVFDDPTEIDTALAKHQEAVVAAAADAAPPTLPDAAALVGKFKDSIGRWHETFQKDLGIAEHPRTADAIRQSYLDSAEIDLAPYSAALKTQILN